MKELLKRLSNGIVKSGPDLANQLALPVGPGAIGQQHNGYTGLPINPKRAAAVAKMPDRAR